LPWPGKGETRRSMGGGGLKSKIFNRYTEKELRETTKVVRIQGGKNRVEELFTGVYGREELTFRKGPERLVVWHYRYSKLRKNAYGGRERIKRGGNWGKNVTGQSLTE